MTIVAILALTVLAMASVLPSAGADGLPEVTITSAGGHVSGTYELEVTVTGDLAPGEVYYGVDGDPATQMTDKGSDAFGADIDTSAFADGPHTISVKAVNTTGESVTVSKDVDVDNNSPEVTISSKEGLVSLDLLITGTAVDPYLNDSAVYVVVDDDMEDALDNVMTFVDDHFEFTLDTTTLDDGSHHVRILAYDVWGNSNKSQGRGLDVDNTHVAIQILSDSGVYSGTYLARARVTDLHLNESSIKIRVVGQDPVTMMATDDENVYEYEMDISGLPEGETSLMIEARDMAGLLSDSTFKITVTNQPNLEIINVSWDRISLPEGQTLKVVVMVKNAGSADATGFKVAIIEGAEVLASVEVTETLSGDQSKDLEIEWKAEGEGTRTLSVGIDPENTVSESNENDNVWGIAADITVERSEEEESPGPGAVMAVLGMLGVALSVRRRR